MAGLILDSAYVAYREWLKVAGLFRQRIHLLAESGAQRLLPLFPNVLPEGTDTRTVIYLCARRHWKNVTKGVTKEYFRR